MSRKKHVYLLVLILALSLLAMGAQGGFLKSAKGKGDYREGDLTGIYEWTYSFSAKESADGTISGFARQKFIEIHHQEEWIVQDYEIDVNCLNIFDTSEGRVAAVSGWTKPGGIDLYGLSPYYTMTYGEMWDGSGHYHWGVGSNSPEDMDCMDVNTYPYSPYFTAHVFIQVK